ncbi:histone deacetylase [Synechococcus sp. W2B2]|uniref:histone deacetylase family protein n=1 Tax=Synechococcus sp. W2B2 TaxID=3392296 RepID=UPI0039E94716
MKPPLVYHEAYSAPLPSSHRFPMAKFRELERCLFGCGLADSSQMHRPLPVPRRWLELVHQRAYHEAFARDRLDRQAQRRIGLPATTPLVRRTWIAVGGTLLTARLALRHGLACHLAGGTHHAFPDFGSGFCIFNDLAVCARVLIEQDGLQRVLVVDLDVHQGDATALIFSGDERVFTFSAHAASNFPSRKQVSDLDLSLRDGLEDWDYLQTIGDHLPELLDRQRPQLVLYNAGVDPHRDDRLGRLCLTNLGLLQRDHLVLDACLRRGIPVASVIGGGYDAMIPLVKRHALVFRAAADQARLHGL